MRAALLALVLGLLGCSDKRNVREWRPEDHDQPEDLGQVEGGDPRQAPEQAEGPEREAPEAQAEQGTPTAAQGDGDGDEGALPTEVLWRQQCARCHAMDGSGRTSMAQRIPVADLRESELDEAQIVRIVTNGRREMPSFADDLDAASIRGLAKKVLELRGGGR